MSPNHIIYHLMYNDVAEVRRLVNQTCFSFFSLTSRVRHTLSVEEKKRGGGGVYGQSAGRDKGTSDHQSSRVSRALGGHPLDESSC